MYLDILLGRRFCPGQDLPGPVDSGGETLSFGGARSDPLTGGFSALRSESRRASSSMSDLLDDARSPSDRARPRDARRGAGRSFDAGESVAVRHRPDGVSGVGVTGGDGLGGNCQPLGSVVATGVARSPELWV